MKKNNNEKGIDSTDFVPGLAEVAKDAPVQIYPQLFNVVGVEHGGTKILLYTQAHYTKEEAIEAFKTKATLKTGVPGHLWVIKVVTSISAQDLEKEFSDIRDQVVAEKKRDKNILMKEIIDTKDLNLLQRHYERFSNHEIEYMHNQLIK